MTPDAKFFQSHHDWELRIEQTFFADFWKELNPHLTISDCPWRDTRYAMTETDIARARLQVCEEGYLQSEPAIPKQHTEALALAVSNLVEFGLHPIFLCAYDEYWQLLQGVARSLEPILGQGCYPLADFWTWYISPETASKGWPPHRDAQFGERKCLREDKSPLLVTAWLPLLDTYPLNGCMSVLPMSADPNLPENPSCCAFSNHQDSRALPAQAGSILAWNQYLLHWGGGCSPWARNPRISSGIYFQSAEVEPYVARTVSFCEDVPIKGRLALASVNLLGYHANHRYPDPVVAMCIRHIQAVPEYHSRLPEYLQTALG
ncbi:MAG: phytanoyl-CoA dioxygenase family protein [Candidatus Eremiobacteraeota bacterium]|nr:phytanoyl-CoA dioxygenase family protein [Candidatus Eremiobacteraeota bacterium]